MMCRDEWRPEMIQITLHRKKRMRFDHRKEQDFVLWENSLKVQNARDRERKPDHILPVFFLSKSLYQSVNLFI